MRRRKYEDDEISTYHREALDFMNFEFSAIEDFELLCKVRNIAIAEDIRSVISFFFGVSVFYTTYITHSAL